MTEVRCLTCGAFMSREAEYPEHFSRETAVRVLAGFAADPNTKSAQVSGLAATAVFWTDELIAELEKPTEAKP